MVKAVCRLVQRRSIAKNNAENEACITSSLQEWIDQSKGMAHRWRYARVERIADNPHLPRLSFAGDAWSEPVGTAGPLCFLLHGLLQNFCGNFTRVKK